MDWQALLTALLVAASGAYAAWTLMPAALRDRGRALLGRSPAAASACGGCDGCAGRTPAPARPDGAQVVRLVRRPPAG